VQAVFNQADSQAIRIYIDGSDRTGAQSGSLSVLGPITNSTAIQVGRWGTATDYFNGQIDRLAFYPYAMLRGDLLRENANSTSIQIGQTPRSATTGMAYDSLGGAAPIAWWRLDEMSGSTAKDYASSSRDGIISGASYYPQGKVGGARSFDGVDDTILMGDVSYLDGIDTFSVGFWMKTAVTDITNAPMLVNKNGAADVTFFIRLNSFEQLSMGVRNNLDSTVTTEMVTGLADKQWHYVMGLYDGSSVSLYVDGLKRTSVIHSGVNKNCIYDLAIGSRNGDDGFFPGQIDDVKIYDYARTPAQIAWDYNRGAPVAHWKFDERNSGTAVGLALLDSSGNGRSGSGANGGSGLNFVTGVSGSAIDFDGSGDSISFNDISLSDQLSVCAWAKSDTADIEFKHIVSEHPGYFLSGNNYTGNIRFAVNEESVDIASFNQALSWHHYCGTYDGTVIRGYLDGQFKNEALVSGNIDNSGQSRIGTYYDNGDNVWDGQIDDVRIYNFALPADQIREVYNGGNVKFDP
jgi:hypothetical protein